MWFSFQLPCLQLETPLESMASYLSSAGKFLTFTLKYCPCPILLLEGDGITGMFYLWCVCLYVHICFHFAPICPSYYVVSVLLALQAPIRVFYIYLTSSSLMLSSAVFSSLLPNLFALCFNYYIL